MPSPPEHRPSSRPSLAASKPEAAVIADVAAKGDKDTAPRHTSDQPEDKPVQDAPPYDAADIIDAIIGGTSFADNFFGEPVNMVKPLRPAAGDAPRDGGRSDDNGGGSDAVPAAQRPYTNLPTVEKPPLSIDSLVIQQLQEDLIAYRADLDFARVQLHPQNAASITPAETRTFQLRVLDLGHQMRMVNHRIQIMQLTLNSGYSRSGAAAAAANAYHGAYPPGITIRYPGPPGGQPPLHAPNQSAGYALPQSSVSSQYPGYAEQDRRRPGRPLGSKNRPGVGNEGQPPAHAPAPPVQPAAATAATALAKPRGKRGAVSEIHVATSDVETGAASGSHESKRARVDEKPTLNMITAVGSRRGSDDTDEDVPDGEVKHNNGMISGPGDAVHTPVGNVYGDHMAAHVNVATPIPNSPVGDTYQRLGYWRCRLCTSQKYINTPPPKQPSEAGSWPLRDVSKMVTHFTRMHGEHNTIERCMELGAALAQNRGPFRHWLTVTKKERNLTAEIVAGLVDQLEDGQMPATLAKVSTTAASLL